MRDGRILTLSADRDNPLVLEAAIDPRFRKMKLISPEDGTRVQSTVEVLAIKEAKAETGMHDDSEVKHKRRGNVPGRKSALDNLLQSDTDSQSEEEEETQEDKKKSKW